MRQIEYSTTRLVSRHQGTLPVLLTCPHDGDEMPAGSAQADGGGIATRLPDLRDSTTTCAPARSRQGIAQRLLDLTGEAPSVVIAEYDREYIDANRSRGMRVRAPDAAIRCAAIL